MGITTSIHAQTTPGGFDKVYVFNPGSSSYTASDNAYDVAKDYSEYTADKSYMKKKSFETSEAVGVSSTGIVLKYTCDSSISNPDSYIQMGFYNASGSTFTPFYTGPKISAGRHDYSAMFSSNTLNNDLLRSTPLAVFLFTRALAGQQAVLLTATVTVTYSTQAPVPAMTTTTSTSAPVVTTTSTSTPGVPPVVTTASTRAPVVPTSTTSTRAATTTTTSTESPTFKPVVTGNTGVGLITSTLDPFLGGNFGAAGNGVGTSSAPSAYSANQKMMMYIGLAFVLMVLIGGLVYWKMSGSKTAVVAPVTAVKSSKKTSKSGSSGVKAAVPVPMKAPSVTI